MKASKILIAVIVIAVGAYIASKYVQKKNASAIDKKAYWYVQLDKDGDGNLSLQELQVMDKNGDGFVTVEEATAYQVPPEVLKMWDQDGDGSISLKELNACGC